MNQRQNYLEAKEIVNYMNIVNNAAKRDDKLSGDFVTSLRNEDTDQENLQSIEEDRKQVSNLRIMNSLIKKLL